MKRDNIINISHLFTRHSLTSINPLQELLANSDSRQQRIAQFQSGREELEEESMEIVDAIFELLANDTFPAEEDLTVNQLSELLAYALIDAEITLSQQGADVSILTESNLYEYINKMPLNNTSVIFYAFRQATRILFQEHLVGYTNPELNSVISKLRSELPKLTLVMNRLLANTIVKYINENFDITSLQRTLNNLVCKQNPYAFNLNKLIQATGNENQMRLFGDKEIPETKDIVGLLDLLEEIEPDTGKMYRQTATILATELASLHNILF